MYPLYDANVNLVGWIDYDDEDQNARNIWDHTIDWVAYIAGGHAWSADGGNWCGPVNGTTCLDQSGRVIAWGPEQAPVGTARQMRPMRPLRPLRPLRPMRPIRPLRPMRPMAPRGGWSPLSFQAWLTGE